MNKLTIINCITALLALQAPTCLAAPAVENQRDQAIRLYNGKNYRAAVQLFDDHLLLYPDDLYALYYNGLACQATGNLERAKLLYIHAYTLAPRQQVGIYAKAILMKLDASLFAHEKAVVTPSSTKSASRVVTTRVAQDTLDHSIPHEWNVPCTIDRNKIYVDVQLNGRKIKMMFDTGDPTMTIGKNQMGEIGLESPKGPPDGNMGGSSSDDTTPFWRVPMRVKVGGVERTVEVTVLENNQADPLLGQSYAGLFECTVDVSGKQIHFRQRGLNKGKNRNAYEVPYIYQEAGNRILVDVEINGKLGRCIFDTGNTAAGICFNDARQATAYGVSIPHDAVRTTTSGITGAGRCKRFTLRRVRMGPLDKTDLSVTVSEKTDDNEPPLLGHAFWEGFEYTINREKKIIEFVRR